MFSAILFTQWKWSRLFLLGATLAGFAIPLMSVQGLGNEYDNYSVVRSLQAFGIAYPVLAAATGLLLALTAWASDHRGRHVYALSLPITRWKYVWLRYRAGLLLLLVPLVAVWIGALLAARFTTIPEGLQPYATSLALRFALSAALAYTAFFAISSSTPRTAGLVLGMVAALVAIQALISAAGVDMNLVRPLIDRLFIWPGPFEIFTGHWMLMDV